MDGWENNGRLVTQRTNQSGNLWSIKNLPNKGQENSGDPIDASSDQPPSATSPKDVGCKSLVIYVFTQFQMFRREDPMAAGCVMSFPAFPKYLSGFLDY